VCFATVGKFQWCVPAFRRRGRGAVVCGGHGGWAARVAAADAGGRAGRSVPVRHWRGRVSAAGPTLHCGAALLIRKGYVPYLVSYGEGKCRPLGQPCTMVRASCRATACTVLAVVGKSSYLAWSCGERSSSCCICCEAAVIHDRRWSYVRVAVRGAAYPVGDLKAARGWRCRWLSWARRACAASCASGTPPARTGARAWTACWRTTYAQPDKA